METLNYEVLKKSGYNGYIKESAPEKVMQFGEGNFLRAFVDYFFDCANEKADWNGKVVLVQPMSLPRVTTLSISYPTQQKPVSYTSQKANLTSVLQSASLPN